MVNIVKTQETSIRVPLLVADATVKLSGLLDHKGNAVSLATFGDWYVLAVKRGTHVELIKCDSMTVNADDTVDCGVA